MMNQTLRGLNFFSPQRKALRDSAFRQRIARLREQKQIRRQKELENSAPKYTVNEEYLNEETIRKNPRVRRMVTRPTAALPRRHYLFIKSGSVPLSLEDLSVPGPSVFDESKAGELLKQKSKKVGGDMGKSESWIFERQKKKGLRVVEWKGLRTDDSRTSVKDIGKEKIVLGSGSSTSLLQEMTEKGSLTVTGTSLISTLKEKAIAYAQTGINPDLMESVKKALELNPGLEKSKRYEELMACQWTVDSLISQGRASVDNFNLLIRSLGLRGDIDQAFNVVDSMTTLGYDCDSETFVSLIVACGDRAERARQAYLQMRQQLIPPTEKVYGALIKAHVSCGDLAAGFALLRKMEDEQIVPCSPVIYTTLLSGLVKQGKTELAWERFRSWRTWRQVKPDAVMFSVMIRACKKNSECERALGVLDDLRVSGEYPTDITYTHLIEVMATRSDFAEKAFEFKDQMLLEGFAINSVVAKALVKACASLGDVNRLRKVIADIAARNIPFTDGMYADAICTIATSMRVFKPSEFDRGVNLKLAWHIVADLQAKSVPVTTEVLNAVVEVYCAAGLVEEAIGMLSEFAVFKTAPNGRTYAEILKILGEKNDLGRFFELFEFAKKTVDENIFHLALDLAMESRSSKRTVSVLEDMLQRNIRPLPAAAERLAVLGRQIVQIHQVVGKMVAQQRDETHEQTTKKHAVLDLELEEHRTRLAFIEGKTDVQLETVENEARRLYWEKKGKIGNLKLSKKDHLERKKKGGRMYGLKVDKPKANLLAE